MQSPMGRPQRWDIDDGGEQILVSEEFRRQPYVYQNLRWLVPCNFAPAHRQPEVSSIPTCVLLSARSRQVYTITMSVVLLNLLIAVLSTAHDEVYVNAEKEFHLARARLIVQSARSVAHRRPPPPLNLMKLGLGVLIDVFTEISRFILWAKDLRCRCPDL